MKKHKEITEPPDQGQDFDSRPPVVLVIIAIVVIAIGFYVLYLITEYVRIL